MIQRDIAAVTFIDFCQYRITHIDLTLCDLANVSEYRPTLLTRILHFKTSPLARSRQQAAITHLPTRFGIERSLVQHHHAFFFLRQGIHGFAITEQTDDCRLFPQAFIARKVRYAIQGHLGLLFDAKLTRSPGTCPLGFHFPVKTCLIDLQMALTGNIGGKISRKAIGVIELENQFPGNFIA